MTSSLDTKVVWGVLMVVTLSLADAAFTLMHIRFANGTEWNPVMAHVLSYHGVEAFIGVKMFLTGLGMITLAWFYEQRWWARYTFWGIMFVYCVLTVYHLLCAVRYWED